MKKTVFFPLFLLALFCSILSAAEEKPAGKTEKPRIAVMDLDAKGVSKDEAEAVADFLRTDLLNTDKFTVIERSRMQDILKEQQLSLSGLTETEKAAKLGKLLNCKFILVGTLSKLGAQYFLNVRAVDVETGETKLGKREKSGTVEEMSEVSRVIASQLAGLKVQYSAPLTPAWGPKATVEEETVYKNPPLGFDIQVGFSPSYNRYFLEKGTGTYAYEYTEQSAPKFFDLRLGGYISVLYFGFNVRNNNVGSGSDVNYTYTDDLLGSLSGTLPSAGLKVTLSDLLLGLRLYKPGQLDYNVMYFSWQTVQWDYEAALNQLKFAGISFGFFGRPGGGSKGCCGFGAGASPVKMFLDYSFYVSYLREKSAATSPGTAFGFSAASWDRVSCSAG